MPKHACSPRSRAVQFAPKKLYADASSRRFAPPDPAPSMKAVTEGSQMSETRVAQIRQRLEQEFSPELIEVEDESHLHAGHPGARDGRGHFRVTIVAEAFSGRPRLERHRMVFAALGSLMQTDVHALAVLARSPDEI